MFVKGRKQQLLYPRYGKLVQRIAMNRRASSSTSDLEGMLGMDGDDVIDHALHSDRHRRRLRFRHPVASRGLDAADADSDESSSRKPRPLNADYESLRGPVLIARLPHYYSTVFRSRA